MKSGFTHGLLLAQSGTTSSPSSPTRDASHLEPKARFIRSFMEHFDSSSLYDLRTVAALLGLVLVVIGLLVLWRRYRARAQRSTPLFVFHQVASQLGLGLWDRLLLQRLAQTQGLPTPLTLLLSHTTLRHHARLHAQRMSQRRAARYLTKIATIRRRVFGDTPPGASSLSM